MKKQIIISILLFATAISNAQNVGIGTTTPTSKLTVQSASNTYGFLATDGTVQVGTYTNPGSGQFGTKSNHRLGFFTNNSTEQMVLLQNGNVGIGTTSPQTDLHVNPNGIGSILLGTNKSSGGYTSLEMGISAQSNGYSYLQSIKAAGTSYGNLLLNPSGGGVQINFPTNSGTLYPLDINQTNYGYGLRLKNSLITSNSWDMYVWNALWFSYDGLDMAAISQVDGSFVTFSDARLKRNVNKLDNVLSKVMALQPKTYQYNSNAPTDRYSTGFIAQEVKPLFPELITETHNPNKSDTTDKSVYYGISYSGFGVIAIKAIQEQQEIIVAQNKRLEALEQQVKIMLNK